MKIYTVIGIVALLIVGGALYGTLGISHAQAKKKVTIPSVSEDFYRWDQKRIGSSGQIEADVCEGFRVVNGKAILHPHIRNGYFNCLDYVQVSATKQLVCFQIIIHKAKEKISPVTGRQIPKRDCTRVFG